MNLANLITISNGVVGVVSMYFAVSGKPMLAAYLIVIGMFLDVMDGAIARLIKKPNPIGKYLDSTADFITFGLAPMVLLFL